MRTFNSLAHFLLRESPSLNILDFPGLEQAHPQQEADALPMSHGRNINFFEFCKYFFGAFLKTDNQ
jgi:hypothetical protein